jgi:hypothetical protein
MKPMTILAVIILLISIFFFLNFTQKTDNHKESKPLEIDDDIFNPNYEIEYGVDYETGTMVGFIDWIAGGNFDGYLYKKALNFSKTGNKVILTSKIIDQSHYDGHKEDVQIVGKYKYTDKVTITCIFDSFEMRGKLLGKNNQYIAFSIFNHDSQGTSREECYKKNIINND